MSAHTEMRTLAAGRQGAERRARRHHPRGQDRASTTFAGKSRCWSACSEACIAPSAGGISPPRRSSIRRLREKGVESLTVVNTPIERARLYFRYHPMPNLLAAADPERTSHRAFGLPNLEFTENETAWPYKVSMARAEACGSIFQASFRPDRSDRGGRNPRQEGRLRNDRSRPADAGHGPWPTRRPIPAGPARHRPLELHRSSGRRAIHVRRAEPRGTDVGGVPSLAIARKT